jgi:phosphopantetheinyl transferase
MTSSSPRQNGENQDKGDRFPHRIDVRPYLRDHRFNGRTIYPAVEILQDLAATVRKYHPEMPVTAMQEAAFDRFLEIGDADQEIEVFHDLQPGADGRITARLVTVSTSGKAGIRREKVHAVVVFVPPVQNAETMPLDLAASLEGIGFRIPADRLYAELVPFGPAFRSLQGEVMLTVSGGIGRVLAAPYPAPVEPLGSVFPFDGIMHIACAWSQRFHGIVAFPVGFGERVVLRPTAPGETYCCRVIPVGQGKDVLTFDMTISDVDGNLRECIRDVRMRDVSGGRIKPPMWIQHDGVDPLATIRGQCRALCVIEESALAPFAPAALTPVEKARFDRMGARRQKAYLSGRLALKTLARKLAGDDMRTTATAIHTVAVDSIRPSCPDLTGRGMFFCSLSHDWRFAVAVAADEAVGVDVEVIAERVLKARHLFMSETERFLTDGSILGDLPAALRVWSIKEGVTKAVNMPIGETWRRVEVTHVGEHESRLTVDGRPFVAYHDTVEDHLFTLVKTVT